MGIKKMGSRHRHRARQFAVQSTYSFECKIAGLRTNVKKLSNGTNHEIAKFSLPLEVAYRHWLNESPRSSSEKEEKIAQLLQMVRSLQPDLFLQDLWDAQLELPTFLQERKLLGNKDHQAIFDQQVKKVVLPSLASRLATQPHVFSLYEKFIIHAKLVLNGESGSDSNLLHCVMAYWVLYAAKKYKIEQLEDFTEHLVSLFLMSYHHEVTTRGVQEMLTFILEDSEVLEEKTLYEVAEENEFLQGATAEHILELEEDPELNFSSKPVVPVEIEFAEFLVRGVIDNLSAIDDLIEAASNSWTIDRMAMIDLCILRIGTFELLKCSDTPVPVIINEAVELAKCFSELGRERGSAMSIDRGKQWNSRRYEHHNNNLRINDSSGFINGVLDNISKQVRSFKRR